MSVLALRRFKSLTTGQFVYNLVCVNNKRNWRIPTIISMSWRFKVSVFNKFVICNHILFCAHVKQTNRHKMQKFLKTINQLFFFDFSLHNLISLCSFLIFARLFSLIVCMQHVRTMYLCADSKSLLDIALRQYQYLLSGLGWIYWITIIRIQPLMNNVFAWHIIIEWIFLQPSAMGCKEI